MVLQDCYRCPRFLPPPPYEVVKKATPISPQLPSSPAFPSRISAVLPCFEYHRQATAKSMTESPSLRCCCRVKALAVWPTPSVAPSFLPRYRHLITVGSLCPPSDPTTTAKSCVLVHLCFLNHKPVPLPSGPDRHCCFSSTRSRCHGKLDPGEPPPLFLPQIGHLPPLVP
jgi:hypothetical protein